MAKRESREMGELCATISRGKTQRSGRDRSNEAVVGEKESRHIQKARQH